TEGEPRQHEVLAELRKVDPEILFWRAYRLYWGRRYAEALTTLDAALAQRDSDARCWSYKALALRALGRTQEAAQAARRAADLRRRSGRDVELIGRALERVQGTDRQFLNDPDQVR